MKTVSLSLTAFALLSFFSPILARAAGVAAGEGTKCADRLQRLADRTLWAGRNPLVLPAWGTRYLIGSLVETDRAVVLAVGGYRTRHRHLHLALETALEEESLGEMRYLWLGEMEIGNDRPFESVGEVRRINPVAGLWMTDLSARPGHENDSRNLVDRLERHYDDLLHRAAEAMSYRDAVSRDAVHLMKRLGRFVKAFERLKASRRIPERETYRHFIGNRVASLLATLEFVLEQKDGDRLRRIEEALAPELTVESLYLYLTWLENDGVSHSSLAPMKEMLERHAGRHVLSLEDWGAFDSSADRLRASLQGRPDAALEEWMAFGGVASQFLDLLAGIDDDAACAGETQIIVLNAWE